MTQLRLTPETLNQLIDYAEYYQRTIIQVMGLQVDQNPLGYALIDITEWLQRCNQSTDQEKQCIDLYYDWLESVHKAIGVYDDWSSEYINADIN